MIVTVTLLGYAAAVAFVGPILLRRARWPDRAPRLGIAMWQAASASVLASVVLAMLALAVSAGRVSDGVAGLLDACAMALRAHYAGVQQPLGLLGGLAAALAVTGWTALWTIRRLVVAHLERRRHAAVLTMIGRRDPGLGAVVIDHAQPAAYCLPGRPRRVVVTSGALACLTAEQLTAVLAHERAHVSGRHHLVLAAAGALSRAFPVVPIFRQACGELARLVELLADDAAARRHERATVAAALATLGAGPVPAEAFGAGGATALARVRRMLAPSRPLAVPARVLAGLAVALLLVGPAAVAASPALSVARANQCHTSLG